MRLNEVLQRLKGVKGSGGQYNALCPVHDDNTQSLSISEKDGRLLLHCHVGCTTESIVSALGLVMKDLFIEERPTPHYSGNSNKPKREIAAVYDYKDLDGSIVHSTIRYDPKGFSQRRPDPDNPGKYIWKDVFKAIWY